MKQTQLDWVKYQLTTYGKVSRNQALEQYITRLGARINDLHKLGWKIEGRWVKTGHGKDYIYYYQPPPTVVKEVKVEQGALL